MQNIVKLYQNHTLIPYPSENEGLLQRIADYCGAYTACKVEFEGCIYLHCHPNTYEWRAKMQEKCPFPILWTKAFFPQSNLRPVEVFKEAIDFIGNETIAVLNIKAIGENYCDNPNLFSNKVCQNYINLLDLNFLAEFYSNVLYNSTESEIDLLFTPKQKGYWKRVGTFKAAGYKEGVYRAQKDALICKHLESAMRLHIEKGIKIFNQYLFF